jgi:methionyl-tRNA formyltransferase
MRLVFAGTPAVALPSLNALARSTHDIVAVVTRPDRPVGRGRRRAASAVKSWAVDAGVDCLQPVGAR